MKTWARVLGYAAGVLGAVCLWLLLGAAPASAGSGPVTLPDGVDDLVVDVTDGAADVTERTARTVRDTVAPVAERFPEPGTDAVEVLEAVPVVVEHSTRVVADLVGQADVAEPAAPAGLPATTPGTRGAEDRGPRADRGATSGERRTEAPGRHTASAPSTARVHVHAGRVPVPTVAPVAVLTPETAAPQAPEAPRDPSSPQGSCTSPSGSGPGFVAEAVERPAHRMTAALACSERPRERAPAPPDTSPGFSPD